MSILRTLAGRASEARHASLASRRDPARRRSRPRLESLEGRLVLAGPGATLDLSTEPYFLQARLPGWDPAANALYAESIATTPDGNVLAVTSTSRPDGGSQRLTGAIDIWERSGREWALTATLTPPAESASHVIGVLLTISADGSTVVASAYGGAAPHRSLLVYERDDAGWALRQSIDAPIEWAPGSAAWQLTGLAISGDGDVIALGTSASPLGHLLDPTSRVQVYTRSGDSWSETARLTPPDPASAWSFGIEVGLSADGSTMAVGSGTGTPRDTGPGSVFVYQATPGGGWGAPTAIDAPEGTRSWGEKISLSADGKTLMASAIEVSPNPNEPVAAAAYLYEDAGAGWTRTARLPGLPRGSWDPINSRWLALSPDGDTAAVEVLVYPARERQIWAFRRDSGWARTSVIKTFGTSSQGVGLFGGMAVSNRDIMTRSVDAAGKTADVYHLPTGFEVILDPSDLASSPGEPTTFLAAATGATGVDVRWQSSDDGGQTWADIPLAVHDWYTFTPTLADSGRMFRAAFTAPDGASVTTRAATLTVAPATPVLTIEPRLAAQGQGYTGNFRVRVGSDGANPRIPGSGRIVLRVTDAAGAESVFDGSASLGVADILTRGRLFAPGTYTIVATYEPYLDPTYGPASTTTQMVLPRFDAAILAELSVDAPHQGQEVSLIVRSGASATGMVSAWSGSVLLGAAAFRPNGGSTLAVIPIPLDAAGRQTIHWTYEGDATRAPETGRLVVDVARVATTIVATPRSGSPIHYYGEPTVYDVVATTADGRPATGLLTVTFDGLPSETMYRQIPADGRLAITLPATLGAHGHVMRLRYRGTDDYMPAELATGLGVYKAPTTVTLGPSPRVIPPGVWVSYVARVENTKGPVAPLTQPVRFYVDGVLAAEAPITPLGEAVYSTWFPTAGTRHVVAVFPETENFQGSVSNVVTQHFDRHATATTLRSTRNPSTAGQPLEFVAMVARAKESSHYPLTGSVQFYLGLNPIAEVPIDSNGRAALRARFDAAGSYLITAVYLGNRYYDTSQSAHLRQSVAPSASAAQAATTAPTTSTAPATVATSPPAPATSAAVVAEGETRKPLTPAQARRAALAARLAARRPLVLGRMRR